MRKNASSPQNSSKKPTRPKVSDALVGVSMWGLIGTVAWQAAGPILTLGIGGALVDQALHTGPLFLLLGVAASFAVSWVLVRGTVRRLQAQVEELVRKGVIKA